MFSLNSAIQNILKLSDIVNDMEIRKNFVSILMLLFAKFIYIKSELHTGILKQK